MTIQVAPFPLPPSADAEMLKDFGRYVTSACEPVVVINLDTSFRLSSEIKGVHPGKLTPEQFQEIHDLLYKVCALRHLHHLRHLRHLSIPYSLLRPAWCPLVPKCRGHPRGAICTHKGMHTGPARPRISAPYLLPPTAQAFDPASESYGHGNNKTGETKKSILHPDLKTIPRVPQVQLIGNGTVYNHEGLAEAKLKHPHHKTFHGSSVSDEDEANGVTRFYRWCDRRLINFPGISNSRSC